MTNIHNELSRFIRKVDGGNKLTARELGIQIEAFLGGFDLDQMDVVRFVERFNHDKVLTAGALAAAIVDKFDLDEEN